MTTSNTTQKSFLVPTIVVQAFCLLMTAPLVISVFTDPTARRLVHESGEVSERLILFTLLCTPLFVIFGWTLPLRYRRTLGVYSFVALAVHVLARLASHGYTLNTLFEDLSMSIGTIGLVIMIALTVTSFDGAKRALGKAWRRLHYGVYAVAIITELHVLFLDYPRLNPRGIVFGVVMLLVLAVRLPFIRERLQARRQRRAVA